MRPKTCTKPALLLCLLCWFAMANAQQKNPAYYDSSVMPARKQPQYQAFINGTNPYQPQPRSQWELGLKAGSLMVLGDLTGEFAHPGVGIHLRKAINHVFSARLSYTYGIAQGFSTQKRNSYALNPAWNGYTGQDVFYNYRTQINDLALEGIAVIDNIKMHHADRNTRLYALAGIGLTTYQARVNKLDANGGLYNFRPVAINQQNKSRRQIISELKELLDDSYETAAENDGNRRPKFLGSTALPVAHVGFGIAYRINKSINLAFEERFTFTRSDLLDGNQWEESNQRTPYPTRSRDAFNFLSLGLNINLGKNAVAPLWWINPLHYGYSELRNPQLMRLPRVVLPDTDGDGIADQFDLEQTPKGVPVDQHGVSRDTDGDGVPDAIDKELMTPTQCQPVNKDGIGKCPCPEDCLPRK